MEIVSKLPDVGKVFGRVQLCSVLRPLLFLVYVNNLLQVYVNNLLKSYLKLTIETLEQDVKKNSCLPTYFTSKRKTKNVRNLNSVPHINPF